MKVILIFSDSVTFIRTKTWLTCFFLNSCHLASVFSFYLISHILLPLSPSVLPEFHEGLSCRKGRFPSLNLRFGKESLDSSPVHKFNRRILRLAM